MQRNKDKVLLAYILPKMESIEILSTYSLRHIILDTVDLIMYINA